MNNNQNNQNQSEGVLGKVPERVTSIAELMAFDTDVNVYGDSDVYIPMEGTSS